MAQLRLILQAATIETHAKALRALLNRPNAKAVLISVAFVREAGVEAIEEVLKNVAGQAKLFVGIRNNITTNIKTGCPQAFSIKETPSLSFLVE